MTLKAAAPRDLLTLTGAPLQALLRAAGDEQHLIGYLMHVQQQENPSIITFINASVGENEVETK